MIAADASMLLTGSQQAYGSPAKPGREPEKRQTALAEVCGYDLHAGS